ncbi:MAG: OmpH family outer membrane protein [Bacteriovoracaceae bacterium]|nr:OmpH family outer membrane protein [Bacteriovoracaceae bacterium]
MKRILILSLAMAFSFSTLAAKIAKVDVQKVLLTVEEGKNVRATLKKKFDEKQKIIKQEEDKIRKMQQDFQKQSLVMNDKAKLKKEKEIQEKIMALQQKTMTFQQEIQGQENQLKKPILEKVRTVIEGISKSGGYDMVFEVSTSPIYVKEVSDITDEVVKAYNKKK